MYKDSHYIYYSNIYCDLLNYIICSSQNSLDYAIVTNHTPKLCDLLQPSVLCVFCLGMCLVVVVAPAIYISRRTCHFESFRWPSSPQLSSIPLVTSVVAVLISSCVVA